MSNKTRLELAMTKPYESKIVYKTAKFENAFFTQRTEHHQILFLRCNH